MFRTSWWQIAVRWCWPEHGTRELIGQVQHSTSRGLQSYRHANASAASGEHDKAGRLNQWRDGPLTTALAFSDSAQLSRITRQRPSLQQQAGAAPAALQAQQTQQQSFTYDPLGQLRQVKDTDTAQAFDYELNGNRSALRLSVGSSLQAQNYALARSSDRLLAITNAAGQSQQSYVYNAVGEPVRITHTGTGAVAGSSSTTTPHYNAQGQIGVVERNAQVLAHYAYNGARQRVAKTVMSQSQIEGSGIGKPATPPSTTYFTWHGGLLDAELDVQGRVQRRVIYLNLRPVALLVYGRASQSSSWRPAGAPQSTQRFAVHGDHLGTPQTITDDRQRVVWAANYDTFGKAAIQSLPVSQTMARQTPRTGGWLSTAYAGVSATAPQDSKNFEFNLRFAGQYEDAETGWHYNWHRFYNPETGRYLTPDPLGLAGGNNAYEYAGGDPLGAVDPWGLYTVYWGGAGLDGPYIANQINRLKNAGISNIATGGGGNGNTILDAANVLAVRYKGNGDRYFDSDPEGKKMMCPEQTNYIGYSYGSLLAAHTALYWANKGRVVNNLVLAGSPIDQDFLNAIRANENIKNVLIYDLTLYGDPIRAGMSLVDLTASAPLLGLQIAQSPRTGHFYYNPDDNATSVIGIQRRTNLAVNLAKNGLK